MTFEQAIELRLRISHEQPSLRPNIIAYTDGTHAVSVEHPLTGVRSLINSPRDWQAYKAGLREPQSLFGYTY